MGRTGGAFAPLEERRFRLLWLARTSSFLGDALVPVALAFAILSIDRSATVLGGVLAAYLLSRVVFTLVGGVLGDRLSRRTIMLASDVVRGGIEAFTAVMLLTGRMNVPLFLIAGTVFGAASAFFEPAATGLVPQTVARERLQVANALLAISQRALLVFGPIVSGLLVAAAGAGWVFAIDAASFGASALFLLRLSIDEVPHEARPFLTELVEGFNEVRSRGWVVAALVGFAVVNLGVAAFVVLGPIIVERDFGGARDWGVVVAAGAVGGVLGATLALRRQPRRPLLAVFMAGTFMGFPSLALATEVPLALLCVAYAAGIGATTYSVAVWEATLQQRIPATALSRVASYDWLVSLAVVPIGLSLTGVVAAAIGERATLYMAAGGIFATSLLLASTRTIRESDEPGIWPRLRRGQIRNA